MKILCLQHADYVGTGSLKDWAEKNNVEIDLAKLYQPDQVPSTLKDYEGLIIFGGPMNIYEEEAYPFLKHSKTLIREGIENGTKVLGICLGGQLISDALGVEVKRNTAKEMGWFPLQVQPEGLFRGIDNNTPFFHWHGDVFDLPKGATLLASSSITPHQAYSYGDNVLALQFHPEINETLVNAYLENSLSRHELGKSNYAQSKSQILENTKRYAHANQLRFMGLLDRFFE